MSCSGLPISRTSITTSAPGCSSPGDAAEDYVDGSSSTFQCQGDKKCCKKLCSAISNGCKDVVKAQDDCNKDGASELKKQEDALCDTEEDKQDKKDCKNSAKDSEKAFKKALKDETKATEKSCKDLKKDCQSSCESAPR